MPTINDLVSDAQAHLHGYVRNQEQVTYLTTAITSTDTTLTVGNGGRVSPGRIAIDDEIMEVDSVDGNTVTLFPFGRGADGSTAAAHDANSRVVASPLVPRFRVLQAIKDSLRSVANTVPGLGTYEFTYDPGTYSFNLPADVSQIVNVLAERPGLTNTWARVNRYRLEKQANAADFAGANSLVVLDMAWPGKPVQVTYTRNAPASLAADTDLVADLGMQETVRDVVVLGAVARLLSTLDVASMDPSSVQALFADEKRQPGSGTRIVSQLWALYRDRLAEERALFLAQNPVHIHFER